MSGIDRGQNKGLRGMKKTDDELSADQISTDEALLYQDNDSTNSLSIHPTKHKKKLTKKQIIEPEIKTNKAKWNKLLGNKNKEVVNIKPLNEILVAKANSGTIDLNANAWARASAEAITISNRKNLELANGLWNPDLVVDEGLLTADFEGDAKDMTNNYITPEHIKNSGLVKHTTKTIQDNYGSKAYYSVGRDKKHDKFKYSHPVIQNLEKQDGIKYRSMYKRNILHDWDSATYHFELLMLDPNDTASAQAWILDNQRAFDEWRPSKTPQTIAETGSTVLSIQSVNIEAVAGPMNNGNRVTGGVSFQITLAQPLGASFTNTLVNAAVKLGMPDGLKATYILRLHFIGRDPKTGAIINPIPWTERQFLINIVGVDTTVDSSGSIMNVMAVRSGDQGTYDHVYTTDRPLQINNIKTINDLCNKLAETINVNELDKLAIEKAILDEYYIKLDDYAYDVLAQDEIVPSAELKEASSENKPPFTNSTRYDPHLRSFVIPQDTGLNRILEFGLSHSKILQNLAKGFEENADSNSTDSGNIKKYKKYIFKIKADVVNIAWDGLRNDYAREYHYTISLFPTIRPEVLQGTYLKHKKAVAEKIKELIHDDFGGAKSRQYRALRKRYDYLFTGLNDKVIRFDIKYNNNFFMALHSYQNLFSGLNTTVQTKVIAGRKSLTAYREKMTQVREAWKKYLKSKADTVDEKAMEKQVATARYGAFNRFVKVRQELVKEYTDAVEAGLIEGDPLLAKSLENLGTWEQKVAAGIVRGGRINSKHNPPEYSNSDPIVNKKLKREYAELIDEESLRDTIEGMDRPVQVMWGATRSEDSGQFNREGHPDNIGKQQFDSVMEASLSDFQADMVHLDMDIKGDMYWLESESDPRAETSSFYAGENYLLFTARTSAGEPSLKTGIATPGDSHKEQLLNGVYAVIQVNSRFEGGMFVQNIKGPRENFIYDIKILENFSEDTVDYSAQPLPLISVEFGDKKPSNTEVGNPHKEKVFHYDGQGWR